MIHTNTAKYFIFPFVLRMHARLWNKLKEQVPTLSLWCASVERLDNPPSWLVKKLLTMCLRSPPAVTREVAKSQSFEPNNSFFIPTYSTPSTIAPSDGPPVRWLKHSKSLPGHTEGVPLECEECGENVFQLLEELGVGKSAGRDGDFIMAGNSSSSCLCLIYPHLQSFHPNTSIV